MLQINHMFLHILLSVPEKVRKLLTPSQNYSFYAVVMEVVILVTDSLENALTKYFLHGYLTREYILLRLI